MVALSCRFALVIFTVARQDRPHLEPDLLAHDPGLDLWLRVVASAGLLADSTGGRASLSPTFCCRGSLEGSPQPE